MLSFIEDDEDASYSPKDVENCGALLTRFATDITAGMTYDVAIKKVEELVLNLNVLNEKCDYCLIETDQREDICEFIFQTLTSAGVPFSGDITEEWRDW